METEYSYMIPCLTKETIDNYVERGWRPGGFIYSCLANDFLWAMQRCDTANMLCLRHIVHYILEHVPPVARGDYDSVERWVKFKGGDE